MKKLERELCLKRIGTLRRIHHFLCHPKPFLVFPLNETCPFNGSLPRIPTARSLTSHDTELTEPCVSYQLGPDQCVSFNQ